MVIGKWVDVESPLRNEGLNSDEKNYFAIDGWSIESKDGKIFFRCVDSGHGGSLIIIEISLSELTFAKSNNPTWNEMCAYLREKGYW